MRADDLCFDGPRELSRPRWSGLALSALIAGMAASAITLASMPGSTPANSSDAGLPDGREAASVTGTIRSDIGEGRAPAGSPAHGMRLASLDTDIAFANGTPTSRLFFHERFDASFGARLELFDDRFGAANAGDRERTTRSTQRPGGLAAPGSMPAAEPGRDNAARPDAAKRPNARVAMLAPAADAAAGTQAPSGAAKIKPTYPTDLRGDAILESLGSRTAIYDIAARVVYLPNGEKLEAHSGLGEHMDDPRSIGVKNKGATPPNIYELSMRERLFHGVRAIRLTPVDPDRMFGRDGILAHSHLLGPKGEFERMRVVRRLPPVPRRVPER